MNVSIVIPTKNRIATLEETLSNIFTKQKYLNSLEIIIINDGESLPADLIKRYPGLIIVKNSGSGAASARNTGAKTAKNELLLFIDDDILIGDNCIIQHVTAHSTYKKSIISGTWLYEKSFIDLFNSTPFGRYKIANDYVPLEGKKENEIAANVYQFNTLASFNLSILRTDFLELDGFNTNFPYAGCEDQEFTMRAREKGFNLLLDTTNVSIHNEKDRVDIDKWLTRQYTGVQGFVLLCELFPFRKNESLYFENTPIEKGDSFKLKLKKTIKYCLSLTLPLNIIKMLTRFLERLKASDQILFKLYTILCGLYIYKGFQLSYKKQIEANKK